MIRGSPPRMKMRVFGGVISAACCSSGGYVDFGGEFYFQGSRDHKGVGYAPAGHRKR
jgi:hypothetical protein